MRVEIEPEPTDDERAAILAALELEAAESASRLRPLDAWDGEPDADEGGSPPEM
jgi:hypothetical protein